MKKQESGKRIFIVDDHPIMRDGISQLINQQTDMQVCGSASSGPEALNQLDGARPDLMLVDISLPGMDGIELIKIIRKRKASLPVLVLSMHPETLYAERAIRAGAKGYIMKHAAAETLLSAIRRVLSGKLFLSPLMAERLLEKAARGDFTDRMSAFDQLSDRELEIFKLMGKGLKPNKMAEELLISIKTVETYSLRLKQKLGARDAAELLQMAISWHKELDAASDPL